MGGRKDGIGLRGCRTVAMELPDIVNSRDIHEYFGQEGRENFGKTGTRSWLNKVGFSSFFRLDFEALANRWAERVDL